MKRFAVFRGLLLFSLLMIGAKTVALQQGSDTPIYTLLVRHDECTSCGDFEVDSGIVYVPVFLQKAYFANKAARVPQRIKRNWRKSLEKTLKETKGQYWVSSLRLERESLFDSLFLLPGRTRQDMDTVTSFKRYRAPWAFEREYRVTGIITGLTGTYLKFRVIKAVLVPAYQRKD